VLKENGSNAETICRNNARAEMFVEIKMVRLQKSVQKHGQRLKTTQTLLHFVSKRYGFAAKRYKNAPLQKQLQKPEHVSDAR